uniref:Uncharacterized protein n=1 Tax=Anguilla anguilla TaxID=7936 RepID=A0A0E9SD94_ANGAN
MSQPFTHYRSDTLKMALYKVGAPSNATFVLNNLIIEHKLDLIFSTKTWLGPGITY